MPLAQAPVRNGRCRRGGGRAQHGMGRRHGRGFCRGAEILQPARAAARPQRLVRLRAWLRREARRCRSYASFSSCSRRSSRRVARAPHGAPPLIAAAENGDRIARQPLARSRRRRRHARRRRHHGAALGRARRPPRHRPPVARVGRRRATPPIATASRRSISRPRTATPRVIAALLDAGADVDAVAPIGETALMTAARTGVVDAVALLLDRGAAVDARDREFEQTALMLAVREAHPEVVDAVARARRRRRRAHARRPDAEVRAAVQRHGLRLRRRRHQSRRLAGPRPARRRARAA